MTRHRCDDPGECLDGLVVSCADHVDHGRLQILVFLQGSRLLLPHTLPLLLILNLSLVLGHPGRTQRRRFQVCLLNRRCDMVGR